MTAATRGAHSDGYWVEYSVGPKVDEMAENWVVSKAA